MTANLAVACLVTGFIAGWLLRSAFVIAEVSRLQERMQRKVAYWQRETARVRSIAEQLARQLVAHTGHFPDEHDWPQEDNR
jgi:predicted exporter